MAGPKRKIYRGGVDENQPHFYEALTDVSGILPGDVLAVNATDEFVLHTTQGRFYVADSPPCFDPLTYVYEAAETGFGLIPRSRDVFLMRAVVGLTFAKDAPLYSNGAGKITTVEGTNVLVGYAEHAQAVATVANELIDVRIK